DDAEATRRSIEEGLEATDLLVTVGGVSVGDHDVVRPALEQAGVLLQFWKVAIKPGKPLALGRAGKTLVLALPGNPASSMVTFSLFGMPLLRAMQGDLAPLPVVLRAKLARAVSRKPGRTEFLRARLACKGGELRVHTLANQSSGAVTSMAWADSLAILPAELADATEGTMVDILRLSDA
ncbi:MAG TPA: molybdopterin-binding protein, partial [Polyangiaceae bacterium]|nr:molybdopterin-binding protein [Polyangiaceae bacterium]